MRPLSLALLLLAAASSGCLGLQPLAPEPAPSTPPSPEPPEPPDPCKPDVDAKSLEHLQLKGVGSDVAPGEQFALRVGHYTYPSAPFEVVPACVTWSIAERDMATVDPAGGMLTVLPGAKGTLHVRGTVARSADPVEAELFVIPKDVAPLAGYWKEQARLDCVTGTWRVPKHPIELLHFSAVREVVVTWIAWEAYRDYSASFSWDPATTRMTLHLTGGTYQPSDVRTSGTARLEKGALILEGIYLGSPKHVVELPACGHRFVR
jgi:hypothetical protein